MSLKLCVLLTACCRAHPHLSTCLQLLMHAHTPEGFSTSGQVM